MRTPEGTGIPELPVRRVVISGASGLLGRALREGLSAEGVSILQLVRRNAVGSGEIPWNPGASPALEDTAALEGCDGAIHLSGANVASGVWTDAFKRELIASRVDTTRTLAIQLASLEQPPRVWLVASAIGIYGDRNDELLNESSPTGSGFLADLCRQWEAATLPAEEAGIRVVHLRFGVVLSRQGGALSKMVPLFRVGLGGRLGSGRQWMSWVSIDDAVRAAIFALRTPELQGAVNVTAPNPVTNAEFTRLLARHLHRPAVLPAPAFALRMLYGQMADEALLASERALPARLLAGGFEFKYSTLNRALAAALDSTV